MKIEVTERDKVLLIVLAIIVAFYLVYSFGYKNLKAYGEELKHELSSLEKSVPDIESLRVEEESYDSQIEEIDTKIDTIKLEGGSGAINKQGLLQYISEWAETFDVDVIRFKEIDNSEANGVWRTRYEIQLGGSLNDLVVMANKLDDLNISYNVLSMSLRQLMDHPWLKRGYEDLSDLPWMNFEKEDEEDGEDEFSDLDLDDLDLIDENDINVTPTDGRYDDSGSKDDKKDKSQREKTIEDKLLIILGEDVEEKKEEKEPVNNPSRGMFSRDALRQTNLILNKYRLDIEIEFIMFRDPNTLGKAKAETFDKEYFVVDSSGGKLSKMVIDNKIGDKEFLNQEIERVEKEIESMKTEGKDTKEIQKYLEYLKGI